MTLYPGQALGFKSSTTGQSYLVHVINVTSAGVAIDANPTLAGENLIFEIQVKGITKGSSGSSS